MPGPDKTCSCGAELDFASIPPLMRGDDGKPHPLPFARDDAGARDGTYEVFRDNGGTLRYVPLAQGEVPRRGRRGINHFATCSDRDQYRKKEKHDE